MEQTKRNKNREKKKIETKLDKWEKEIMEQKSERQSLRKELFKVKM